MDQIIKRLISCGLAAVCCQMLVSPAYSETAREINVVLEGDIFNRRDTLMESLTLELMPVDSSSGESIAETVFIGDKWSHIFTISSDSPLKAREIWRLKSGETIERSWRLSSSHENYIIQSPVSMFFVGIEADAKLFAMNVIQIQAFSRTRYSDIEFDRVLTLDESTPFATLEIPVRTEKHEKLMAKGLPLKVKWTMNDGEVRTSKISVFPDFSLSVFLSDRDLPEA